MAEKKPVGKITHFYPKISVAVVELNGTLKQGEKIKIEGHGQSFEQTADSMQIDLKPIKVAKAGQSIGLKVLKEVKDKDLVFKA